MERQQWLQGTLYRPDFEQDSCGKWNLCNAL
jgi:glutamate synthase (NADPH/NADH) large chain